MVRHPYGPFYLYGVRYLRELDGQVVSYIDCSEPSFGIYIGEETDGMYGGVDGDDALHQLMSLRTEAFRNQPL